MARDLDDFIPLALTFAPNAPEPLLVRHLREAARELCHDAKIWRAWDEFETSPPACVGICTIADAQIVEIENASINDHSLKPTTVGWLNTNRPEWLKPTEAASGSRYITQLTPTSVVTVPPEAGHVRALFVLRPSLEARTLPEALFELYGTDLGRAAAGLALMTPGVDFANPQLGSALYSTFMGRIATLKIEHTKGQQGSRLRTTGAYL